MSFKTRLDQLNVPAPRSTSQLIIAPLSNQSILQSTLFTTHTHTYSTQIHTHANSVTLQLTSTYTPKALSFVSHLYILKQCRCSFKRTSCTTWYLNHDDMHDLTTHTYMTTFTETRLYSTTCTTWYPNHDDMHDLITHTYMTTFTETRLYSFTSTNRIPINSTFR